MRSSGVKKGEKKPWTWNIGGHLLGKNGSLPTKERKIGAKRT